MTERERGREGRGGRERKKKGERGSKERGQLTRYTLSLSLSSPVGSAVLGRHSCLV